MMIKRMGHFQDGEKASFVASEMVILREKNVFQHKSIIFVSQGFRNRKTRWRKEHRYTKRHTRLFLK